MTSDGVTIIHQLAQQGASDSIKLLHKRGMSMGSLTVSGESPIDYALRAGHSECMNMILDCDPTMITEAIFSAVRHDCADAICLLYIRQEGIINVTDCIGTTPLMYCAQLNSERTLEKLVRLGADVNKRNIAMETALWIAVKNGSWDVAKTLFLHPLTDRMVKDVRGRNILHIAKDRAAHERIKCYLTPETYDVLCRAKDSSGMLPKVYTEAVVTPTESIAAQVTSPLTICHLCADVLYYPIIMPCGHQACRACVFRWYGRQCCGKDVATDAIFAQNEAIGAQLAGPHAESRREAARSDSVENFLAALDSLRQVRTLNTIGTLPPVRLSIRGIMVVIECADKASGGSLKVPSTGRDVPSFHACYVPDHRMGVLITVVPNTPTARGGIGKNIISAFCAGEGICIYHKFDVREPILDMHARLDSMLEYRANLISGSVPPMSVLRTEVVDDVMPPASIGAQVQQWVIMTQLASTTWRISARHKAPENKVRSEHMVELTKNLMICTGANVNVVMTMSHDVTPSASIARRWVTSTTIWSTITVGAQDAVEARKLWLKIYAQCDRMLMKYV